MFVMNEDLSIYATRGDIVFFSVAAGDNGVPYKFQPGDIVRMAIYGKKEAETCVMQKDFPVEEVTERVFIYLDEHDTKIGEIISKHKDYWYEVVLNPDTMPQTIIGYDEDGPKIFRLFPESEEIDDNYDPKPEDFPVVDEELDMTSPRPIANKVVAQNFATVLDVCERTNKAVAENFVSPEMYGAIGDGKADDTESLMDAIANNEIVELNGHSYLISETLDLHSVIRGGTIIFNGAAKTNIFSMKNGGGFENVKIVIKTPNFSGTVILADYTVYTEQFNPMRYKINGLIIDNTICDSFVDGSCCFKIRYDKYKVIYAQNISNVRFDGRMDYGIYVEPVLRDENDNPVFNTATFSNFFFNAVNCAIKVLPTMASGSLDNAKGCVVLQLDNFANQHINGITKAFMDLHNTTIFGKLVVPWDYYGDNIPSVGTYLCKNSNVYLDYNSFHSKNDPDSVRFAWTRTSTGESYSYYNHIIPDNRKDEIPTRSNGMNWGRDNVKMIAFSPQTNNPYGLTYIGFEFQRNNASDPTGRQTVQFGVSPTGTFVSRIYEPDTKTWSECKTLYMEGKMPQSYSGKRPDGTAIGDMKFDTTVKKPVWWNGSAWILADGTVVE
jgi:hypothetical protein